MNHDEVDLEIMAITRQDGEQEHLRWVMVLVSTGTVVALLAAYAFLVTPEIFYPGEVTVTGTVTAPGVTLSKIVFVNTGCGTRTEVALSSTGESSAAYTATLDNDYTYNVSVAYSNVEGEAFETQIGKLTLDTPEKSITRDWAIQP
jgi:hypothetical protein